MFFRFLAEKKQRNIQYLHEITTLVVEQYKLFRLNTGVANRSINIELNLISNAIKTATEWGYRVGDVSVKRLRESKKLPRYFSKTEIELLLGNASRYMHQIITISLFTGLRINELLNLKWEHINFEDSCLYIVNTDSFHTKTRRDRVLPMNSYLKQYIMMMKKQYVDPNTDRLSARTEAQTQYLISAKDGGRVGCVRKAYKRLLNRLGIENASLHTLRHTFASLCIMNQVDLYTIKEFLGHSRVTTTEIYTHINQEHKLNNIEKLSGIIAP